MPEKAPNPYDKPLPREWTVPVICRIKRKFFDYKKHQMMYELEPIVLPEREECK